MRSFLTILLSMWIILAPGAASQSTIYVDASATAPGLGTASQPFVSVQAAINAALPGDTITVAAGEYVTSTHYQLNSAGIRLVAPSGPFLTTLRTTGLDSVIYCVASPGNAMDELEGFTIRGGRGRPIFPGSGSPLGGGGVLVDNAFLHLNRCIITDNHVATGGSGFGGGVYLLGSGSIIENCIIAGNSATSEGGGFAQQFENQTTQIRNCLIFGNSALRGAAIANVEGSMRVVHSTIADNIGPAGSISEVLYHISFGSGPAEFINCILRGSNATVVENVYPGFTSTLSITGSDVRGPFDGIGSSNIDADPLFRDAAAFDFRLRRSSPCLDAGVSSPFVPMFDPHGVSRPRGPGPDMGAFEFDDAFPSVHAAGNVGSTVTPEQVLTVNGQTGGFWRQVSLVSGDVIALAIAQPTTNPAAADFFLFGKLGIPTALDQTVVASVLPPMEFPPHIVQPLRPDLFTAANSLSVPSISGLLPAGPTPWTAQVSSVGLGAFTVALQGVIFDAPGRLAVTNAVLIEVN